MHYFIFSVIPYTLGKENFEIKDVCQLTTLISIILLFVVYYKFSIMLIINKGC